MGNLEVAGEEGPLRSHSPSPILEPLEEEEPFRGEMNGTEDYD